MPSNRMGSSRNGNSTSVNEVVALSNKAATYSNSAVNLGNEAVTLCHENGRISLAASKMMLACDLLPIGFSNLVVTVVSFTCEF